MLRRLNAFGYDHCFCLFQFPLLTLALVVCSGCLTWSRVLFFLAVVGDTVKGSWVGTAISYGFLRCIYVISSHFHVQLLLPSPYRKGFLYSFCRSLCWLPPEHESGKIHSQEVKWSNMLCRTWLQNRWRRYDTWDTHRQRLVALKNNAYESFFPPGMYSATKQESPHINPSPIWLSFSFW